MFGQSKGADKVLPWVRSVLTLPVSTSRDFAIGSYLQRRPVMFPDPSSRRRALHVRYALRDPVFSAAPEPSSRAMLGLGFAGLA